MIISKVFRRGLTNEGENGSNRRNRTLRKRLLLFAVPILFILVSLVSERLGIVEEMATFEMIG